MSSEPMFTAKATGSEIQAIVLAIEKATRNKNQDHVYMGCLTLALLLQNPNLTMDEMLDGVKAISEYVAMYLSGTGEGTKVN